MADVERVLGQQHRVAGDLEVILQQVLRHRCGGSPLGGVSDEVIRVELVFVVTGGRGRRLGGAEVVRAVLEGVAQHAVAGIRPVERVGRRDAPIDPVALVGDVDGVTRVDEAAVLGAAAKEVLAVVLGERLHRRGLIEVEGGLFLHDHLVAALDGHEGRRLVELDGGLARSDHELVALRIDLGLRVGILVRGIRLSLDLRRMLLAAGLGVLAKLARRVHVVAEDVLLKERDLALDFPFALGERDRDHVIARLDVLDARERGGLRRRREREG